MLMRILQAIVVAVVVGFLIAVILTAVLGLINTPVTDAAAKITKDWGWPIGVIAGLWYYAFGGNITWPSFGRKPE